MWDNRQKKKTAKIDNLVGEHAEFTGDVTFSGGLHVDGIIEGNILAQADSNSVLSLSNQGTIKGEITVPYVIIEGAVTGNVYSSELVELGIRSRITGDVYYNLLKMSSGSQVSGRLAHTPNTGHQELIPAPDESDDDAIEPAD